MDNDIFHKINESGDNTPIAMTLSNVPESIDGTKMNEHQIHEKILKGYESYQIGQTQNAAEAFKNFRKNLG